MNRRIERHRIGEALRVTGNGTKEGVMSRLGRVICLAFEGVSDVSGR